MKLKMLSKYHPETDGSSEQSNKTVVQALCYHVERNQKGWARALPRMRFNIMNTVNISTGFSPFQLQMGRLPRLIPPLTESTISSISKDTPEGVAAIELIDRLVLDVKEAQDNLLAAKVVQAEFTNRHHGDKTEFKIGDKVLLSIDHCCQ